VITYDWFDVLPPALLTEVEGLLAEAVEYDAEAGFSTADPLASYDAARTAHLIVRMPPKGERGSPHLDRLPDVSVVSYLRLDSDDGVGEVQFVVRPAFRSLGVATLLFELLRDQDDGWSSLAQVRRVQAWAHGDHPAADRMKGRFGARLTDAVFKTFREIGGSRPFAPDAAGQALRRTERRAAAPEVAERHRRTLAPADQTILECGTLVLEDPLDRGSALVGIATPDPDSGPALVALNDPSELKRDRARSILSASLVAVQGLGARVAQLYVAPMDDEVLAASRELEFVHDQSDLRYELDLTR